MLFFLCYEEKRFLRRDEDNAFPLPSFNPMYVYVNFYVRYKTILS